MAPCTLGAAPPSKMLYIRTVQAFVAILYLFLFLYSLAHRGWWLNLSFPTGFGVSASLLTTALGVGSHLRCRIDPSSRLGRARSMVVKSLKILTEVLMVGMWIGTFLSMLLPKGKDFRFAFVKPMYGTWCAAVVFSNVEM